MSKNLMVQEIKNEAEEILKEVAEIKKVYKAEQRFTFYKYWDRILDILVCTPAVIIFMLIIGDTVVFQIKPSNEELNILIAIMALYVCTVSGLYLPSTRWRSASKTYTYCHRVKNKVSVNKLMVALRNANVKGARVVKINTQYNGKDMYLEIEYK